MATKPRTELAALLAMGVAPFYLNGIYNPLLARSHLAAFWTVEVLTWIVMPAVLLFLGRRRGLFTWKALGLSTSVRGTRRPWLFVLLILVVSALFRWVDYSAAEWSQGLPQIWTPAAFHYADVVPPPGPQTGWFRLLALCHLCITAGVVEELYYRAMMDRLFPRGWVGASAYGLVSSMVFAGAHWEGGLRNVAEAFVVGLFAAALFRLTRNVWPLILGHIMADWYWLSGGVIGS